MIEARIKDHGRNKFITPRRKSGASARLSIGKDEFDSRTGDQLKSYSQPLKLENFKIKSQEELRNNLVVVF